MLAKDGSQFQSENGPKRHKRGPKRFKALQNSSKTVQNVSKRFKTIQNGPKRKKRLFFFKTISTAGFFIVVEVFSETPLHKSGTKKAPKPNFGGNFVDRKVWGNFGQWGVKKSLGVQGLQSHFFHYGGHAPPHNEKIRLQTLNT